MKARRHTLLVITTGIAAASALMLASCASTPPPLDANAVISKASAAMGADAVKTLRFAASGTGSVYGQAYLPDTKWPSVALSSFSRAYDYEAAAMREEFARSRTEPNGGGALPLMGEGEQRAIAVVQGALAWNMVGPAQVASPVAIDARIHDLWTSPHGVLKAAAKNKASAMNVTEGGQTYSVLSFSEPGRFTAKAFVNAQGLVEKVESRMPHPVMGESAVITMYSDYKAQGGTQFPARIRQTQEGTQVLDVQVSEVQVNAPVAAAATDLVRGFAERAASEQAAPGVWFIAGGSHNSVAIEMADHVILVESPLYDGRAAAVLAEVKRLVPSKPIRFVINSHHHFDHAGGLRAAVADGATLVTSMPGVSFFQKAFATPNSIAPDMLTKSGRTAKVEGYDGRRVFTDSMRSVELHAITANVHAQGFNMVYLPKEKMLIQADAFTPGAPNSAPPAKPNGNHVSLIANIERLGLKVDNILPLHGRIVPVAELYRMVGRSAP
jgi:glyoxylase-like metal-dependent hydrolase (beta-lactamase superfamily II)